MAKDDYFVLVYKFLSYLYKSLKCGKIPQESYLHWQTKDFPVEETYFNYVVENLMKDGYIENVLIIPVDGANPIIRIDNSIRITPKGIEYLEENSSMKRIATALKEVIDIVKP